MTIVSKGYAGPVLVQDWRSLWIESGAEYSADAYADFRVTALGTGLRQTSVAEGLIAGQGIKDVNDAPVTLTHDANTGGVTRYDLVVARRTWASHLTTIVRITGSTSQATAIAMRTVGAAVDDQPLALVPIAPGASNASTPIDLRAWKGQGGCFAASSLVTQYLTAPGTSIRIGETRWDSVLVGATQAWATSTTAQAGQEDLTVASPEVKHNAGAPLAPALSITGPPRNHAIYLRADIHGGFNASDTSLAVKFFKPSTPGVLVQNVTPVHVPAGKWGGYTLGARVTGLTANQVTQVQLQGSADTCYHRGTWSWSVVEK